MFKKITSYQIITYIAAVLSGVTTVLLLRRFFGIAHDSVLYLGQGLLYRYPEIFSQDVFFLHGGQDRYTIFPWLLGQIFYWMEPLPVFKLGTLGGLLLFTAASWYFLKNLLPAGQRYIAWMGVLCLPPMYGYTQVFSYGESFFTMRTYSEALCLFGMAFITQFRWKSALVFLTVAGLLHPLQILVILPFIWLWLVAKDKRWLYVLWLSIPIIILSLIGVHPLDGLFERADPFWFMTIQLSPHLFITLWNIDDFVNIALDLFILILACKKLASPFNALCKGSIISLLLCVAGTLILVDWLHLVFPTGLQLWRAHWLTHWFAMASFSLLFLKHWQEKQWTQAILLVSIGVIAWGEKNWGWTGIAIFYLSWPWLIAGTRIRLKPLLNGLFGFGFGLLCIKNIIFQWKWFSTIGGYDLQLYAIDYYLLSFPAISLFLIFFAFHLWHQSSKYKPWILILMLLPISLWGILKWDMRSDEEVAIYSSIKDKDIFNFHIPENAQIYWDLDSPIDSWYILNRSHYYSRLQAAGQVFSRGTAVEGYDRWLRIKDMNGEVEKCKEEESLKGEPSTCRISDAALYKVCSPSLPPDKYPPPFPAPPDYLILPFAQPQTALGQWMGHYLYSCASLMEELEMDNTAMGLSS